MAQAEHVPVHRPSSLKQQNKKHNTLGHRTKGQVQALSKGRVSAKLVTKSFRNALSKEQRRHQAKQIRANKKEEAIFKKRQLGTNSAPPFLAAIIPLSRDISIKDAVDSLTECDDSLTSTMSSGGILHISSSRLKQRFSFAVIPNDELYSILDTVKVCDTVLFLWKMGEELSNWANLLLSSLLAQGLPSVVHAVVGGENFPPKDTVHEDLERVLKSSLVISEQPPKKCHLKARRLKELQLNVSSKFPGHSRLYFLDKPQDAKSILRQIGSQKQQSIFFRDQRSHMIVESVFCDEKLENNLVTLKLHGYIRGQPMSVNRLIHLPGHGDFQISQMDIVEDPYPLLLNRSSRKEGSLDEEPKLLDVPNPDLQETLDATYEIDPKEEEQTWPTEAEIKEAIEEHRNKKKKKKRRRRFPTGTSDYQAAWFLSSDDEEDHSDAESQGSLTMDDCPPDLVPAVLSSDEDYEEDQDEEEEEEEDERTTLTGVAEDYDNQMDYVQEMDFLAKMKAAKEDTSFPDEVDTPLDIPARIRFQKYRGLQSFRTSPWDKNESLPTDYGRIAHFRNFTHTKRRIFKEDRDGALPGWYVVVHLKDVPASMYFNLAKSQAPLAAVSLLRFEQKMSLLNVTLKSHPSGHFRPIKSKERLIFQVGFRRFANAPIFSEHSTGDKHKFFRFFHPGQMVVASMFAPVTFPPCPVSVFKERLNGSVQLVAVGSVLSADPDRIICKKVILSGHPFKVNRKSAVVRYMFFNPEDIQWFKSVELRTKWGKRGHIKEPLGTHGHMKCQFNGQLKSQDTVLMNLYKRVFPKWQSDTEVQRPLSLHQMTQGSEERSDPESSGSDAEKDCYSHKPKKKKVRFLP